MSSNDRGGGEGRNAAPPIPHGLGEASFTSAFLIFPTGDFRRYFPSQSAILMKATDRNYQIFKNVMAVCALFISPFVVGSNPSIA
jgi:hypothetical protein